MSDHLKKVKQPGTSSLALLVMGGAHHLDDPVEGVSGTSPHKLDIRGSQLGVNIIRMLLSSSQQGSGVFTIQPSVAPFCLPDPAEITGSMAMTRPGLRV